jgi:F0F1-type ATP synthase assembly protein I
MSDGTSTAAMVVTGTFAVICCAGLFLIAAIGTAALTGWLTNLAYALIPALLIGLGLGTLWIYRSRAAANAQHDLIPHDRGAKL